MAFAVYEGLTRRHTTGEVFRPGGSTSDATATCLAPNTVVSALPKTTVERLLKRHRYVSPELEKAASSIVPEGGAMSSLVKRRSINAAAAAGGGGGGGGGGGR